MNTPWIGEETDKENLPFNVRSCQSNGLDNHVALLIASACILAAADNEPFDIQGYNQCDFGFGNHEHKNVGSFNKIVSSEQ